MTHEVPDPQPLVEDKKDTAQTIAALSLGDYEKIRNLLLGPAMGELKKHYLKTGSLT